MAMLIVPGKDDACKDLVQPNWDMTERPKWTISHIGDNGPTGCLRIYERELFAMDFITLQVAGIGGVFVKEEYRGKGRACKLLAFAHTYLKGKIYPCSVLYSIKRNLYERFGYEVLKPVNRGESFLLVKSFEPSIEFEENIEWTVSGEYF